MSMFTRFVNIRNALNINNFNVIGSVLNIIERPDIVCKSYSTADIKEINEITSDQTGKLLERKSSKAMKAYLEQSKAYKNFIEKQIAEYNIGKRHLANMMGEDPNNFTQQDIDNSIKYLFPSGLFEKEAVPIMKHPDQLYQSKKEAEFDDSGRPHHFLFYTIKPNYYESLYIIADSFNYLNKMEDKKLKMHIPSDPENKIDLTGSTWLDKAKIENMFLEKLTNLEYDYFIKSMEKLVEHPLSKHVSSVIMKYRVDIVSINKKIELPKFEYDSNNRPFILISDCLRKSTRGQVKVIGNGSGNITINGKDIRYFSDIQCREQVSLKASKL